MTKQLALFLSLTGSMENLELPDFLTCQPGDPDKNSSSLRKSQKIKRSCLCATALNLIQ